MKLNLKLIEKFLFLIVVLLNIIPVLSYTYFPTMDGPAHLYNSNLITHLLFEDNQQLHEFYKLNTIAVPNWIGHFILSFFNLFLPAFLAEKILLLIYFVGLPYSFRRLIITINPKAVFVSYFIFPFTYSFLFLLGFYNFSLALIFLFIILNFWLKNEDKNMNVRQMIVLFLLLTLTYFSHVFIFVLSLLILGLRVVFTTLIKFIYNSEKSTSEIISVFIKKSGFILIAALVPITLFLIYYFNQDSVSSYSYLDKKELMLQFINLKSLIVYSPLVEQAYTRKIFYLVALLTVYALTVSIFKINESIIESSKVKKGDSYFWFFVVILILALFLTVPDSDGDAGYISFRLGYIAYLLVFIWFSYFIFKKWLTYVVVVVLIGFNLKLVDFYSTVLKDLNKIALDVEATAELIEPNSVVLPINSSSNWLMPHFSNYLGIEKPMVILENYEASTGYFPVNWNINSLQMYLEKKDVIGYKCENWLIHQKASIAVDYVFILGNEFEPSDVCKSKLNQFHLIYETDHIRLYKRI